MTPASIKELLHDFRLVAMVSIAISRIVEITGQRGSWLFA
jgi:hypothetical protein